MSASSSRGLRLIKAMEKYAKVKPNQFDTNMILSKIKLVSASEGQIRGAFVIDSSMCNNMDSLHGGYISSVIDTMATFATISHTGGKLSWTTNLHVDFLKSARKGETIVVETNPLKYGNNTVMEAMLRNESTGAVVAKGIVSLLAGADKYQELVKGVMDFDVYEN